MKTLGTLISIGLAVLMAGTAVSAEKPASEQEHLTVAASGNFRTSQWTAEDLAPRRSPTAAHNPVVDPMAGLAERLHQELNQRLEQQFELTRELDN